MNIKLKRQVIELRKGGKTYSEIKNVLGYIPKGTLSTWLKNIELTPEQKLRIQQKITDCRMIGRQKGAWRNHQKRLQRIKSIQMSAKKEYRSFLNDKLFLMGLALYLAEGSRKIERFQFMNSDPYLVKIMIKWLNKIGKIPRDKIKIRLYMHKVYARENCENFWINFLNLNQKQLQKTIYKSTQHLIKKNPEYKGCLRIEIPGTELFWKIMKWRDLFYNSL